MRNAVLPVCLSRKMMFVAWIREGRGGEVCVCVS